jgi:hypothetical protein
MPWPPGRTRVCSVSTTIGEPREVVTDGDEVLRVLRWRFTQMLRAGYLPEQAVVLSVAGDVDLHLATDLLRRGCSPGTALRILL